MTLKLVNLLLLLALVHYTVTQNYKCSQRSALLLLKRPAYHFSTRILDRAAQNENGHFVFSPLTTWFQLATLAEGATGITFREIWKVTRHHRNRCFKQKLAKILHKINKGLKSEFRRRSVMVLDDVMAVKKGYMKDVLRFYGVRVLLKNFAYPVASAREVNKFIDIGTNGVINEAVYYDDFESRVMIMSDNVYFRSAWLAPFNTAYTKLETFTANNETNKVNMMNQIAYYKVVDFPRIQAKVLEIPCVNDVVMLVFLPKKELWVGDIYYNLQWSTLNSIFKALDMQGPKLVNLKLPRFKINTMTDNLPELLFDLGVRRVFDPKRSELRRISDFTMYASLMTQIADIEVTEQGVSANATAEALLNETVNETEEFFANTPFAYAIIDRKTQFIIFGGAYSIPSVF